MNRDELAREIAEALADVFSQVSALALEVPREKIDRAAFRQQADHMAEAVLDRIWPQLERMQTALEHGKAALACHVFVEEPPASPEMALRVIDEIDAALSPEPSEATP